MAMPKDVWNPDLSSLTNDELSKEYNPNVDKKDIVGNVYNSRVLSEAFGRADEPDTMDEYRKQSEITKQEIANARAQEDYQKRRIEEKQIRALRAGHRGIGIAVGGASSSPDSSLGGGSDKLGG